MTKKYKKIIVKVGSSIIAPKGKLDSKLVSQLVKDILTVEKKGYKVVMVSSGAIACGLNKLGFKKRPQDTHSLMAISSLGQSILMDVYSDKFKKHKKKCAQILLTWDDFDNRKRFINIRKTIDKLLFMDIIPIINENDAVAFEEIGVGDNDRISSFVTDLLEAELLIILSDVEGLLDGEKLVKKVDKINSDIMSLAKKEDKTHTKGGMFTKLEAAKIAISSGAKTVIGYGRKKNIISDLINGKQIGTLFSPLQNKDKARKRWISLRHSQQKQSTGTIKIDDGARDALLYKGKSLLNVGIISIEGSFEKSDVVGISDKENVVLGCGIANYSASELKAFFKKRLEKPVIHRDNFTKVNKYGECPSF